MKGFTYALVICCITTLSGCASILGPSTNDPALKLKWAADNFGVKNRPAEAEKQIREAMDIYVKKNDQRGLAEAYRQYGLFYRSNSVSSAADYYNENGFLDKTVKFKDRYDKAIEHFNLSRDLFADLGLHEDLSTLYISLAKTYVLTDRRDEACAAFNNSQESYVRVKMADQGSEERRAEEIASYMEYVESMRKQAGCPDTSPPPAKPDRPVPTSPYAPPSPYAPSVEPATKPAQPADLQRAPAEAPPQPAQ